MGIKKKNNGRESDIVDWQECGTPGDAWIDSCCTKDPNSLLFNQK
jgi:hypothetical protein